MLRGLLVVPGLVRGYYHPSLAWTREHNTVLPRFFAFCNAVRLTWWCLKDQ